MSMWGNMSFGEKLLGIAALGTGVGEIATGGTLFDGVLGGALGSAGSAIDSGAQAIGSAATSAGAGISNFFNGAPATTAATANVNPETVGDMAVNKGLGAGAASAATPPANAPSGFWQHFITPATGSTGTLGTGMGYGAAGQLGMGALGLAAIKAANKGYGVPGVAAPTGPLSQLNGAQGVGYLTNRNVQSYASGGITANPNPPMAYNQTPQYATSQNTPVAQPVMRFDGSSGSQVPNPNATSFTSDTDWMQAMQENAAQQQALQAIAQEAQQQPQQQNPYQTLNSVGQNVQTPSLNLAGGGIAGLGSYSDGGQLLKGPGDGMSDSIPATINNKQPARLANDEFVVPADVVSHLGNGSSDAGAKKLYSMMDRVRRARTGSPKQAKAIHPDRYMPG